MALVVWSWCSPSTPFTNILCTIMNFGIRFFLTALYLMFDSWASQGKLILVPIQMLFRKSGGCTLLNERFLLMGAFRERVLSSVDWCNDSRKGQEVTAVFSFSFGPVMRAGLSGHLWLLSDVECGWCENAHWMWLFCKELLVFLTCIKAEWKLVMIHLKRHSTTQWTWIVALH